MQIKALFLDEWIYAFQDFLRIRGNPVMFGQNEEPLQSDSVFISSSVIPLTYLIYVGFLIIISSVKIAE